MLHVKLKTETGEVDAYALEFISYRDEIMAVVSPKNTEGLIKAVPLAEIRLSTIPGAAYINQKLNEKGAV